MTTRLGSTAIATVLRNPRRRTQLVALLLVAVALLVLGQNVMSRRASADPVTPTSSSMETALGVRFSRIAVVGDGGLVEVSYLVLDPDKATRFQSDRTDIAVISNDETKASTKRISVMKQGHTLRAGQTYYFIYNNSRTLHGGDHASITTHGISLQGIPVQ
ncbi:MAG: hypothetical protein ABI692_10335 [Terracoccus sp.]